MTFDLYMLRSTTISFRVGKKFESLKPAVQQFKYSTSAIS